MDAQKLSMADLGRLSAEEFKQANKLPLVVVLDNVRSMHNVGSVFRTSDAFLIDKIVLCGYTPQPPHREIHKTALGATETVAWSYASSTLDTVNALKSDGYMIAAIEQTSNSQTLSSFAWDGVSPLAVVFGNEVDGVQQAVIDACHMAIEIPQAGTKHSLNISVAAGIVLYTLFAGRQ
jgi:23S rRNA (guanosine2251-2'-O)-methyltransferase